MEKYILLSIQPHYVKEMIVGNKQYEFRKKLPNLEKARISKKVFIYCSKPVMPIIGSFIVKYQYYSDFDTLMNDISTTKEYKNKISEYLIDKSSCHALEVSNLIIYKKGISLKELREKFNNFHPGQSYRYLSPLIINKIKEINSGII